MKKFEEVVHEELQKSEVFFEEYNGNFIPSDEKGVLLRKNGRLILFPWLKFARDWVSPEDHQAVVNKREEYSHRIDDLIKENLSLGKEKQKLKSQLEKQQPEIPEFVAELFNEYRFESIQKLFEFGIEDIKSNVMIKALQWRDENPNTFALAFITANYTVSKEKRFYLKNKLTGLYLYENDKGFSECERGSISWALYKTEFTQSEIDSMETGSYEQIEVVK